MMDEKVGGLKRGVSGWRGKKEERERRRDLMKVVGR